MYGCPTSSLKVGRNASFRQLGTSHDRQFIVDRQHPGFGKVTMFVKSFYGLGVKRHSPDYSLMFLPPPERCNCFNCSTCNFPSLLSLKYSLRQYVNTPRQNVRVDIIMQSESVETTSLNSGINCPMTFRTSSSSSNNRPIRRIYYCHASVRLA